MPPKNRNGPQKRTEPASSGNGHPKPAIHTAPKDPKMASILGVLWGSILDLEMGFPTYPNPSFFFFEWPPDAYLGIPKRAPEKTTNRARKMQKHKRNSNRNGVPGPVHPHIAKKKPENGLIFDLFRDPFWIWTYLESFWKRCSGSSDCFDCIFLFAGGSSFGCAMFCSSCDGPCDANPP